MINFSKLFRERKKLIVLLQSDVLERHDSIMEILNWRTNFECIQFLCDRFSKTFYSKFYVFDNVKFEENFVNLSVKSDENILLILENKYDKLLPQNCLIVGFSKLANVVISSEPIYAKDLIDEFAKLLNLEIKTHKKIDLKKEYALELVDQVVIDLPSIKNFFKMKKAIKYFKINFSPKLIFTKRSSKPSSDQIANIISAEDLNKIVETALESKMIVSSDIHLLAFLDKIGVKQLQYYGNKNKFPEIDRFQKLL